MRIFIQIVLLLLIICLESSGQQADSVKYKSLEPYDFHLTYLKSNKALLIDVREFFEYQGKRIKGAVNIPSSGNLEFSADTIDKRTALFLYCTTDFRSIKAAVFFSENGFETVYNLEGGILAWKKDGFPVVKNRIRRK